MWSSVLGQERGHGFRRANEEVSEGTYVCVGETKLTGVSKMIYTFLKLFGSVTASGHLLPELELQDFARDRLGKL